MPYTGNIPTYREEALRAQKALKQYKRTVGKKKVWKATSLFYDELNYTQRNNSEVEENGLIYNRTSYEERTVIKKVPELILELSPLLKRKEVIEIFQRKYGYDKYKKK